MPVVIDPDFGVLVRVRVRPERRAERAGHVVDARHAAGDRRAVDVHVEQRQENRDLLPRRPAALRRRAPRPRASRVPSAGASTSVRIRRRRALRIAEEQRDRDRQHEQRARQHGAPEPRRATRRTRPPGTNGSAARSMVTRALDRGRHGRWTRRTPCHASARGAPRSVCGADRRDAA